MSNIIDKIRLSGTDYTLSATTSGVSVVEVTQDEYDALPTSAKTDTSKMYVITDAQAGDLSQYWTSAQTQSAITQAVSGKQDTLSAGTGIDITDNVISATGGGGGGKAIEAGTNISVTTGTTADTINCTLPIREGSNSSGKGIIVGDSECTASGLYGIAIGHNADANGNYSFAMGSNSSTSKQMSFAFGDGCKPEEEYNFMFGRGSAGKQTIKKFQFCFGNNLRFSNHDYEISFGLTNSTSHGSATFGHSGNTLFAIGNGYDFQSTHNYHNAIEIRQNGDIYIPNTNDTSVTGDYAYSQYPMIKLQDYLGGGGGGGKAIEAGRGIAVTTGATADTVSFNLPISAGTGTNSLVVGGSTTASGFNSFAGGDDAIASGNWCFAFGRAKATNNYTFAANGASKATMGYSAAFNTSEANNTYAFSCGTSKANGHTSFASGWDNKSLNNYESSFGYYNVSSTGSSTFGDSGNTLFSVGNGTADNARHNAFEIRQNGDIYLSSGGTDILLQDHLGGGGSITIDPSLDSGSTNAVANSAITNALHETYLYQVSKESDLKPETKFFFNRRYIDNKQDTYSPTIIFAGINGTKIAGLGSNPDILNFSLVETSAITTSVTSASTDSQVPSAKAVNDKLGGLSLVKLTQNEYDALATKDSNTLYVIVN